MTLSCALFSFQAMAAQQQQRVAQANAVAANISSLNQRNNAAVLAAAMKSRGRQQQSSNSKAQSNANLLRNNQTFKNFNANMLSSNYQLAAATLAAANTQFLQQVVVSFNLIAFLLGLEINFISSFFILGPKTSDA